MGTAADLFGPDLIVTTSDGATRVLVVEVKLEVTDLSGTENRLKAYMLGRRYPLGLLITPTRLWIYLDRYTSPAPASIERLGPFSVGEVFGDFRLGDITSAASSHLAFAFEERVQSWLERLPAGADYDLPLETRNAIREHLLPALMEGEVRAAGPRTRIAGPPGN